jgi:subtilisin family serine protease
LAALLDKIPGSGDEKKVRIAVFDTWPMHRNNPGDRLAKIRDAKDRIDLFGENARLNDLANGTMVHNDHIRNLVEPHLENRVHGCHRKGCDGDFLSPSNVSDHGVFVANIINDLLPEAEIWVYRVLDDWGVGNQERLARAVRRAVLDAQSGSDRPDSLVLNLSLGIGPPPRLTNLIMTGWKLTYDRDAWAPVATQIMEQSETGTAAEFRELLVTQVSRHTFDLDEEKNPFVLPIAASGNDACRQNLHDQDEAGVAPRFPAGSEEVIGVSAVDRPDLWCEFSNQDDYPATDDDGISAAGGDIVGLYTHHLLERNINREGWAKWSGTSFATPVISAIAGGLFQRGFDRQAVWDNIIHDTTVNPPVRRWYWDLFQKP